ncbi:hypothetical protein [Janthinobacterium sp.]|uniref:hypothetical protein n=1 Tax=Janthinobacterium sp. TaxID=1871054 RepID=UPI00293D5DFF|nr:hypothetical protein [Janthinobacterium sp.]
MNIRHQLDKARHGPRCRVGGDKQQNATSTTQNYDNRQINTTTSTALSNSGNTTNMMLDGGAVAGIVDLAKLSITGANAATKQGYDYADHIFSAAELNVNAAGAREADAYAQAGRMVVDAMSSAKTAYAGAQSATQAAYADAKGTTDSQKQIMLGVLVVAGVIAIASMKRG